MQILLRNMRLSDLEQVNLIEQASFPTPWSTLTYVYEIKQNPTTFMGVMELVNQPAPQSTSGIFNRLPLLRQSFRKQAPPNIIVAYGGVWVKRGEAHISTIASHQDYRRQGLGELMLVALLGRGIHAGASISGLEVRISNTIAQQLYRKYGYENDRILPSYYHDNREDAFLMKIHALDDDYLKAFCANVQQLGERIDFKDQFSGLHLETCDL